ncbi:hypothetical protein Bca101_083970 [Brassica carinata]
MSNNNIVIKLPSSFLGEFDGAQTIPEKIAVIQSYLKKLEDAKKERAEWRKQLQERANLLQEQRDALRDQRKAIEDEKKQIEDLKKSIAERRKANMTDEQKKALDEEEKAVEEREKTILEREKETEDSEKVVDDQLKEVEIENKQAEDLDSAQDADHSALDHTSKFCQLFRSGNDFGDWPIHFARSYTTGSTGIFSSGLKTADGGFQLQPTSTNATDEWHRSNFAGNDWPIHFAHSFTTGSTGIFSSGGYNFKIANGGFFQFQPTSTTEWDRADSTGIFSSCGYVSKTTNGGFQLQPTSTDEWEPSYSADERCQISWTAQQKHAFDEAIQRLGGLYGKSVTATAKDVKELMEDDDVTESQIANRIQNMRRKHPRDDGGESSSGKKQC